MHKSNCEFLSRTDRFIPKRIGSNFDMSRYFLFENRTSSLSETECTDNTNCAYETWRKRTYEKSLWQTVFNYDSRRVLNFFEHPKNHQFLYSTDVDNNKVWPSKPRKKPFLKRPCMILDLPIMEERLWHNIIDWGSNNCLATIYDGEVCFWNPNGADPPILTTTGLRVKYCVKWNCSSSYFAFALNHRGLGIWDCSKQKIIAENRCCCNAINCLILSLEWSSNNLLISGCSKGNISLWNSNLELLKNLNEMHDKAIIKIALSCKENYCATVGFDNTVRVWLWPTFIAHHFIIFVDTVKAIAWHPWEDPLLAAGATHLTIWKVSIGAVLGYQSMNVPSCIIDCLAWNPVTGELVVSYHNSANIENSRIIVLSDLYMEVDNINWHERRVLYLLWNADASKLATADKDKGLCICEFLRDTTKTKAYKSKKKSCPKLNSIETLKSFNSCIR